MSAGLVNTRRSVGIPVSWNSRDEEYQYDQAGSREANGPLGAEVVSEQADWVDRDGQEGYFQHVNAHHASTIFVINVRLNQYVR